jgi:carbamoyltransferase
LLGPDYSDAYIASFLKKGSIPYQELAYSELPEIAAGLIDQGQVIGWFQGRLEFGPRALGARSIIGDARNPRMQSRMNLKIKYRESFRPFAPAVLAEKAADWFALDKESPYMLLTAPVKEDKRMIPAVTHVDYSARVQTVKREDQPLFYDLINAFYEKTGCPVIINTSFNVRGEPLVCSPEDAFRCFMRTEMDYLVLGKFLLDKKKQARSGEDTNWKKEFILD